MACLLSGDLTQSTQWLAQAVAARPTHGRAHHLLALALVQLGATDPAAEHYARAVQLQPATDRIPALPARLAANFAEAGRYDQAARFAERALDLARRMGDTDLAHALESQLASYRQHRVPADAPGTN
jgi:Tfp pilus assembly protein PilF